MRTIKIVGLGAVISLAGCASLGMAKFQYPTVDLNSVVVRGLGLTGGSLDLMLEVNNPNGFDIRGTKLDLGLDVEGTHFGDVELNDAFNLPKNQPTIVVVPLTFEWVGVGAAARSALVYGTVKYVVKGNATVQTPFGMERVPFSRNGTVSVSGMRQAPPPPPTNQ